MVTVFFYYEGVLPLNVLASTIFVSGSLTSGVKVLVHPPYNSQFSPCDFHVRCSSEASIKSEAIQFGPGSRDWG